MAIFSSARTSYLTYYIVLADSVEVARLQALYPQGVNRAPETGAAIEFAAPWRGYAQPSTPAPYSWSPVSSSGGGGPYPLNVATFTRHTGGFLGIGGTNTHFFWMGMFVYLGAAAVPAAAPGDVKPTLQLAPIAKRRWIEGFEIPLHGPIPQGDGTGLHASRDAAKAVGGIGLALRGSSSAATATIAINAYTPGLLASSSWERFSVRVRKLPNIATQIWRANGAPSAAAGCALAVTPVGDLVANNISATSVVTLLGTVTTLAVWDGTSTLDAWHRIDALIDYNPAGTAGLLRVYVDGLLCATFTVATALGGLGAAGHRHASSSLGNSFAANTGEIDTDDWISCDTPVGRAWNGTQFTNAWNAATAYVPGDVAFNTTEDHVYICTVANTNVPPSLSTGKASWHRYEGLDWLNGSKVQLIRPKAFSANHNAAWVGDFRLLSQNAFSGAPGGSLATTTASALCAVDTDAGDVVPTDSQALGVGAIHVVAYASRGTANGSTGYAINGGAAVMTTEAGVNGTLVAQGAFASPDGVTTDLLALTALELRYQKGADVAAGAIKQLLAMVELIGVFGAQDWRPAPVAGVFNPAFVGGYQVGDNVSYQKAYYTAQAGAGTTPPPTPAKWTATVPPAFPRFVGQHNAPYIHSPWAIGGLAAPPGSAFIVKAGTYVGNGLGQELTFRAPVHLLWVRPLTGGAGGFFWLSTGLGSHRAFGTGVFPNIVDAQEDLTFVPGALDSNGEGQQQQYRVRLASTDTQLNASTIVYQYVAISDPGARFILNAAFSHLNNAGTVDNPLIDPTFTADFLLLMGEGLNNTTSNRLFAKSAQQAPASLAPFLGTVLANALTIGTGTVTTQAALHTLSMVQFAAALFRKHDGNNDPHEAKVFSVGGYAGDGSASRTLSLPPTGCRPLFALIFSEAATGYWRDPSHLTNTSTDAGGATATTAITGGGIDTVLLGSLLNANGVNYSYLILWADATACNGGWGCNGEYIPVEAAPPTSGPFPGDPDEPTDDTPPDDGDGDGDPVIPPNGPDPDLSAACVAWTQRLVNLGLMRIGITKQIADLAEELSMEAVAARLMVTPAVDATLRDFPWPFATRYAELVLVAGTALVPANNDWQYAYRSPTDMAFGRRMARKGNLRAFESDPIEFRVGSDANGGLIYSNEAATATIPLVLEYTIRMSCPAQQGDAQFRNALAWRFAAELAPGLSKDQKRQQYAWAMYEDAKRKTDTSAANEQQQTQPDTHDADWIQGR